MEVTRLQALHHLLQNLLMRFRLHNSLQPFAYALLINDPTKSWEFPVPLLLALAKLAIYLTGMQDL